MKPILFSKTATSYTSNGLGRLDAISCKVTEERNGMFEFEMEIAETASHANEIEMCSIIVAKPSQSGSNQAFRVYRLTKPINGKIKVYAQHISYQLSYIPVMPFTILASSSACAQTLAALKSNAVHTCPFNFSTDITTVNSYSQSAPASLRSRLGGVDGSVLDQFGGEYKFDNFNVYLLANRGVTNPTVSLRYGKNITDLNQEENIQNTITGIVPYWQNSEGNVIVTLPEKVVESANAANFPFKRTVPYDFSQAFQEEPTVAQLRAKAQAYVNQSGIGVPKVSIKLSFVSLADTEEYKDVAAIQAVNLCDNVGVYFEKLGISTTAKIVKTVYDVLKEKYESVEIGSLRSTLSSTISSQNGAITTLANNTQKMFKQYNNTVGEMIDTATAWLTKGDGFVVAVKNTDGSWKELLFMDTADIETAHNVLRVNQNGIGFSSTGVAGPYTQAWTLDGKMVIGGTNVPSLTVYDNSQNILFRIDKNGLQWNAPNSSMDTNGNMTIKNGTIVIRDANNNVIFQAASSGMLWNAENSSMTADGTLSMKGGIIKTDENGARIVLDGSGTNTPTLTVYDANNNVIFQATKSGTIWNSENSSMDAQGNLRVNNGTISAGTVTGATIQNAAEGSRVLMDSSSSLKGYYGNTLHNIINMSNRNNNDNDLIIDADHELHIRTPKIYVAEQSAGTGSTTVYETLSKVGTGSQGNGLELVTHVSKKYDGYDEYYLANVPEEDSDVLVTLPVILNVGYSKYNIRNGLWTSDNSTRSEDI